MHLRLWLIAGVATLLTGCGPLAVRPGFTPTVDFDVSQDVATVWQRADKWAWGCHLGGDLPGNAVGYVHDQWFPREQMGVIRISGALIEGPERVYLQVRGMSATATHVRISVRDDGHSAQRELGSALLSITTDKVRCVGSMPHRWTLAASPVLLKMSGTPFD